MTRFEIDAIWTLFFPSQDPFFCLALGKSGCGLLDVRGEVRELLHLSSFNYLILRTGASLCPFDCFFLRLHLDHPGTSESLLRLGKRPVANLVLPSRE